MITKRKEFLEKARRLTVGELSGRIAESQKQLFTLNQEKILGKLKNVSQIRQLRVEIARLATIIDEKVSQELVKTK